MLEPSSNPNPWDDKKLEDFLFYLCPECHFQGCRIFQPWTFKPWIFNHELSIMNTSKCSFLGWGTIFAKLLQSHIPSGEATSDMTYARVPLWKLCKNCPHPERFVFLRIKIKSHQMTERSCWKNLWRSHVTCKEFLPIVEKLVKSQSGHAEKPFVGHMWFLICKAI